jgi:hypothetical protein
MESGRPVLRTVEDARAAIIAFCVAMDNRFPTRNGLAIAVGWPLYWYLRREEKLAVTATAEREVNE